jgi:hypothetical protein
MAAQPLRVPFPTSPKTARQPVVVRTVNILSSEKNPLQTQVFTQTILDNALAQLEV